MDFSIPTRDEIEALNEQRFKVLENRLRRAAERQGLRLEKSRRRDPRAIDFGTYMLIDIQTNSAASYRLPNGYGLDLHEVATYLFGDGNGND